jgi:N-acetylglucosamine kinase-like BadF-type ATPase
MRHDRTLPLVDQLADAAAKSADPTARHLFTVVRHHIDDHAEAFFIDPTSDNLQALTGLWTRAVKLLKETPESLTQGSEAG